MGLVITGPDLHEIIEEIEGQHGVRFNRERISSDGNRGFIILKAHCEDPAKLLLVHGHLKDRLVGVNASIILKQEEDAVLTEVAVSSIEPYYWL
jgi:hypothetical protein